MLGIARDWRGWTLMLHGRIFGQVFAWTEAILLLATIAQRWTLRPVSPPTLEPRITLRPKGLSMRVAAR